MKRGSWGWKDGGWEQEVVRNRQTISKTYGKVAHFHTPQIQPPQRRVFFVKVTSAL
jgi:hypothetical protein